MLFRLKEREELEHLRHLVAELKPLTEKVALLEQQNAEKDARLAEQAARISQLENEKAPSQPARQSETPPS